MGTCLFSCSHTQVPSALYCPSRGVNALKCICHLYMLQADPSPVRMHDLDYPMYACTTHIRYSDNNKTLRAHGRLNHSQH